MSVTATTGIFFNVNGKDVWVDQNLDPELSLAYFLRNKLGLRGTKLGCEEGVCGSCTVVLATWDDTCNKAHYRAVNACLVPLFHVHKSFVITVEGVGSRDKIHPIQDRLARGHALQCGFCSPGFVMSAYALLRNHPNPTIDQINSAIRANLCRCTGYRPILEALYSFSYESSGCCGGKGAGGSGCCKETRSETEEYEDKLLSFEDFPKYDPTQEIIFPPSLRSFVYYLIMGRAPLHTVAEQAHISVMHQLGSSLHMIFRYVKKSRSAIRSYLNNPIYYGKKKSTGRPRKVTSRDERNIIRVVSNSPKSINDIRAELNLSVCKQIVHNAITRSGTIVRQNITRNHMKRRSQLVHHETLCLLSNISSGNPKQFTQKWVSTKYVKEFNEVEKHDGFVKIGSALTIQQFSDILSTAFTASEIGNEIFKFFQNFSSPQVANFATWTGSVISGAKSANSVSDTLLLMSVLNAKLTLLNENDELIQVGIEKFTTEKILWKCTIVNAVFDTNIKRRLFCIKLGESSEQDSTKFNFAALIGNGNSRIFVGLGGPPKRLEALENHLNRKESYDVVDLTKVSGIDNLAVITKFSEFLNEIQKKKEPSNINYLQYFKPSQNESVGRPLANYFNERAITGEALYVNDIQAHEALHLGFVLSTVPHAEILSIDASEALTIPGVVGYFGVEDIPGNNTPGMCKANMNLPDDTKIFADKKVESVGQVIGVIAANDVVLARRAAKLVKVEYRKLPALLDLQEAIKAESLLGDVQHYGKPEDDVKKIIEDSEKILEGEINIGGQEHFYLETQSSLVVPGEGDELIVHCSTQGTSFTQLMLAECVNLPAHKIIVKVGLLPGTIDKVFSNQRNFTTCQKYRFTMKEKGVYEKKKKKVKQHFEWDYDDYDEDEEDYYFDGTGKKNKKEHYVIRKVEKRDVEATTAISQPNTTAMNSTGIIGIRFPISCTTRGVTPDGLGTVSLCSTCWVWRRLPSSYYPAYLNEVVCDYADTSCLSGYASCQTGTQQLNVLRNDSGKLVPVSVSAGINCECRISEGSALESLVLGQGSSAAFPPVETSTKQPLMTTTTGKTIVG
uniref:FAD-binding PCMH-type domain-containing protein n=2 Tax=Caenorhabditis japonica TaxID=281687 RepID=A0A8R1ES50_CAEJA